LLPRIIAAARALRAAGLGAALTCVASETAAAHSGEALAAAADGAGPFAPLGFAVLFGLAAACAALVVATIADRIDRSGGR
jgi:amino acid transporter